MTVSSRDGSGTSTDLLQLGVSYFVDVQPSGQYTSILRAFGGTTTEFGRIEVEGAELILHREQPTPRSDPGTFRISGDTLFLSSDTEFDLDRNGVAEAARLLVDLKRRIGVSD